MSVRRLQIVILCMSSITLMSVMSTFVFMRIAHKNELAKALDRSIENQNRGFDEIRLSLERMQITVQTIADRPSPPLRQNTRSDWR